MWLCSPWMWNSNLNFFLFWTDCCWSIKSVWSTSVISVLRLDTLLSMSLNFSRRAAYLSLCWHHNGCKPTWWNEKQSTQPLKVKNKQVFENRKKNEKILNYQNYRNNEIKSIEQVDAFSSQAWVIHFCEPWRIWPSLSHPSSRL